MRAGSAAASHCVPMLPRKSVPSMLWTNSPGNDDTSFGGGVSNFLATEMGSDLQAAAPFYGQAADTKRVPRIKASLVIHYAEDDPRVNAMRKEYEAALTANKVDFVAHLLHGSERRRPHIGFA